MYIEIQGSTKRFRKFAKESVEWTLAHLLNYRLYNRVEVEVILDPSLYKREGVEGHCLWVDNCHRPRAFTMSINTRNKFGRNIKPSRLIRTIQHECVHVKQWITGELQDLQTKPLRWQGEDFNEAMVNYWDLPWEVEAHGREYGLLKRFCEDHKYNNTKWYKEYRTKINQY